MVSLLDIKLPNYFLVNSIFLIFIFQDLMVKFRN
jgi:hypothetical protein